MTINISVSRGKWYLRQSRSVEDLAPSDGLRRVRLGSKSLIKKDYFFISELGMTFFP